MGLLPNVIEAQKSLMSKSKSNYEALKRYMDKLTQYMELIDVAWEDDAGEKYYIFKELNSAGKAIAEIASGYKTYTVNVNNVLNLLKEFLEFAGIKCASGYTFTPAKNKKSSKTRVRINTEVLKGLGTKVFKLGQSIEEIELDYKSLAAKVDDQVDSLLRGKITSLSTLNRKLDKQALSVMKAGTAIVQICNNYETAEKNINKKAADIVSGKQVVFGDGKVSNVQVGEYDGGSYNLPSMTTYSMIQNPYTYPVKNGKTYETIKNFTLYTGNNYSQKNSIYIGTEFYNCGCGATSVAICKAIMSGKDKNPKDYYVNGVGCVMGSYGSVARAGGQKKGLEAAYNQIKNGIPSVVQLNGPEKNKKGEFTTQHFVAVVGVVEGADPSNLKPSDFLAVDPVGGKIKRLDECYKSVGGTKGPVSITSVRYYK